jgi:hypothetical protein
MPSLNGLDGDMALFQVQDPLEAEGEGPHSGQPEEDM